MEWETDDMSLAAYLMLALDEEPEYSWDGESCFFIFISTSQLNEEVAKYYGNQAVVNPREYSKEFSRLKRATFRHPDSPKIRSKIPA
jgi:hypothetical protein